MMPRQITIVASELLGRAGTGGAGTADSLLAVALGRHGHSVRLLIASGREIGPLNPEWMRRYESAGVEIRVLEREPAVRPPYLAPPFEVLQALRENPPEVVIADDWRGLAYLALRARQTALALAETAFVIHCHGPGRVLTEFAQKVPDTPERFGEQIAERSSIELADVVVSPSEWLLDWMRVHGWPVSENEQVIQYLRESAAFDETPEPAPPATGIRRLAFFGQLREGKGIRLFVDALGALEHDLLEGVEVVFLGSARGRWAADRVLNAISPEARERLGQIRFEPSLDREAALAELRRPGTLAVMPSLLDNSPNTVAECIEHRIPFLATATGGIPELVADDDRARVLCGPAAADLAAALARVLSSGNGFAPARPARKPQESVEAWLELIESVRPDMRTQSRVATTVAVIANSAESARRGRRLADSTRSVEVEVVEAASRRDGLFLTASEWILFLDDDDDPDDGLLDVLVAAQTASGADVVTPSVRGPDAELQLFLGDPGALGLVENQYGVVGLLRSSLAVAEGPPEGQTDPDWLLFARLAVAGATVISIPEALAAHARRPGRVGDVPGEGLAVLEAFEQNAGELRDLPQFAATLAAALARQTEVAPPSQTHSFAQRLRRQLAGLARATLVRR
jgi:glycosyltransferase involved in cell wall biosynthesis